ncbi:uncharacterized protein FN964_010458 [Alca torda]
MKRCIPLALGVLFYLSPPDDAWHLAGVTPEKGLRKDEKSNQSYGMTSGGAIKWLRTHQPGRPTMQCCCTAAQTADSTTMQRLCLENSSYGTSPQRTRLWIGCAW